MTERSARTRVLIYAIHRTQAWWKHIGEHMGYDEAVVLTDRRNAGDRWLTDDFYRSYKRHIAGDTSIAPLLSADEVADCVARCRALRQLPRRKAEAMAQAMAEAADIAVRETRPDVMVSFPIDNYVQDTLARRAKAHGIPYFELTASALPGMSMLLHRGRLITSADPVDPGRVADAVKQLSDKTFRPTYVRRKRQHSVLRFVATVLYFKLRGLAFLLYSAAIRDPLNFHYVESRIDKAEFSDVAALRYVDPEWREKLAASPNDKRVLIGLQIYPEAAIDYWIRSRRLIQYEDMVVHTTRILSEAGYQVLIKDHPLQFGHNRARLTGALRHIPNVVIVPSDVPGEHLIELSGASVTLTGTLGLQAAMAGKVSIVGEAYYVGDTGFVVLRDWDQLADLPDLIEASRGAPVAKDKNERIVERLLSGSFPGDYHSFANFNPQAPSPRASPLGRTLGSRMRKLGPQGEDWHRRSMASQIDGRQHGIQDMAPEPADERSVGVGIAQS